MLRTSIVFFFFGCLLLTMPTLALAQVPTGVEEEKTESSDDDLPLDGIVEKKLQTERRVLEYEPIREADVFWEKRVWRIIDVSEKMNKPFAYPGAEFAKILIEGAQKGELRAFAPQENDQEFKFKAMPPEEVSNMISSADTSMVVDPETYKEIIKITRDDINYKDIKRFRVKEVWFFDEESSVMKVRVLGISPLREVYDDNGNFRYELPMFWIYYPEARKHLAKHLAFNPMNDASPLTWEDVFEMRYFSSFIFKVSNEFDRRIVDYMGDGVNMLLESDKIKTELFNFEHDLWEF